ncbi:MAG: hypothetical protein ABWX87_13475, partial [Pseudoxanthomonas sp.]
DPRDDLSGRDAARKGLILGRLLGYRGAPPEAENLVPPRLARYPLAEFLGRLPSLDEDWAKRVKREAAAGRVLRYLVVATPRSVRAYLAAVPVASVGAGGLIATSSAPPSIRLAFSVTALMWLATALLGLVAIRRGRVVAHRRGMVRS